MEIVKYLSANLYRDLADIFQAVKERTGEVRDRLLMFLDKPKKAIKAVCHAVKELDKGIIAIKYLEQLQPKGFTRRFKPLAGGEQGVAMYIKLLIERANVLYLSHRRSDFLVPGDHLADCVLILFSKQIRHNGSADR